MFSRMKQIPLSFLAKKKAEANLNRQLDTRFANDPMVQMGVPSQPWSSYPREQQKYLVNKGINATAGYMQPAKFLNTVHAAKNAPNLNVRLTSQDAVMREAQEQLLENELLKAKKDILADNVIEKIHKRLLNQEANMIDNMPNLFRRKK